MYVKVIVPRFRRQRGMQVFADQERGPLWKVAERAAQMAAYAPGTNYSFAKEGKALNPAGRFEDQVSEDDLLHLLIL